MAARIYADVPGSKCTCGGSFSKRIAHHYDQEIKIPVCDSCGKHPWLYLIDADSINLEGRKARVKIRHDQKSRRLDHLTKVMSTLDQIVTEMNEGQFDIRKYESASSRESFIFRNYIAEYLKHHERRLARGEITPKGLKDKKGLIARELLPFFRDLDLSRIDKIKIHKFRDEYTSKLRTRDLALGELKVILNQAVSDGMLLTAPKFDKIPRSKKRKTVIDMALVHKTIAVVSQEIYRDMFGLLAIYPIRPGELRALKWKDIDFKDQTITVERHFSDEVDIEGRKSISDVDEARMVLPLMPEAMLILMKYRQSKIVSLNRDDQYIFLSIHGTPVREDSLGDAWRSARKIAGHKFQAYEIRHARLSEMAVKSKGNIPALLRVSGHTNATTLMERYIRDNTNLRDLF